MPEAGIDEDGDFGSAKDDVRAAFDVAGVQAEPAQPGRSQCGREDALERGLLAGHRRHHPRTLSRRHTIHAGMIRLGRRGQFGFPQKNGRREGSDIPSFFLSSVAFSARFRRTLSD
jgi:hypothetical protein